MTMNLNQIEIAKKIAVVVCMFLMEQLAWAGPNEDAAREAVKKATVAYNLGQYEASTVQYEEAYRLVQDPSLLYNIGQSYRMANKPDKATTAYKAYLRTAPDDAPAREQAQKKLDELEWSTFGPGNPRPTPPVRTTPIPIPQPKPTVVTPIQIKIEAETPSLTPPPAADRWKKWTPWIATGITAVLGTSSIIAGLAANSAYSELEGTCGKTKSCTNSQINGVKSKATITNVLWGLTATSAVATGGIFFYPWRY
jgi:tetratricopeptide (TPR) repeat protein